MSALSGCSSYEGIAKALDGAMSDSSVSAVLFDVNSPGGSTNGCFELTDKIYGYRGRKPMWAAANDLAASAAYSIASAADRIYVTRTGAVGSIGVFSLHCSQSKLDDKLGLDYTYVFYGARKVDGNEHEPYSKSAKDSTQAEVDRQGDIFTTTVARNRKFAGATFESIRALQAGVKFADTSTPLLADAVGTYDDALAELSGKVNGRGATLHMTGKSTTVAMTGEKKMADEQASNSLTGNLITGSSTTVGINTTGVTLPNSAYTISYISADHQARMNALTEELEAAKAQLVTLSAADKKTPPPDPDDDGDEDCDPAMKNKKSKKATDADDMKKGATDPMELSAADMRSILELGQISGKVVEATAWATEGKPLADFRKFLLDSRAKESAASIVNPNFGAVSTDTLDGLEKQVAAMVASSNGKLSTATAMEQLLLSNPASYSRYLSERDSQTSKAQGGIASPYMQSLYARYPGPIGGASPVTSTGIGIQS